MKKIKKFSMLLLLSLLVSVILLPVSASAAPKLNKTSARIYIGKTVKLKISGKKGKVKWQSSNPSVASVSSSGSVKGKKAGKAVITAKVGSKKLKCTVKVKRALIVDKKSITIKGVGKSAKIKVDFLPNGTVTFQEKNVSIISGKWGKKEGFPDYITVTGKKPGKTSIKIYNNFNKEVYTVSVEVKGASGNNTTTGSAFDNLARQIKNVNFISDGAYTIVNSLSEDTYMLIQYNEGKGTICFTLFSEDSSSNVIIQMTIYKNSNNCYLYLTTSDGSTAVEYEKTTVRSQIHNQGYIRFEYTDSMKQLMELLNQKEPTAKEQSNANKLFNLFLKGCNLTIPGRYHGKSITITMKNLFPNF